MGVRDLNSVAKRYAPESITTYSSIRDFRGKTLAIDANLVTTKFHFANPYPLEGGDTALDELAGHRHARAWYYFLRRLKQNDINPIVVFDGSTRLDAKARENERRRLAREVQRLRSEAEQIRGERLRTIRAVLAGVDQGERDELVASFRDKAREILDDRAARSQYHSQEGGQDVQARVGVVESELAKLDADRKRVRELIEAFERVVKAERADSSSSMQSPSASPSATPSSGQVSSSPPDADETSARPVGDQADAPSPLASPDADAEVDETAAAPDLRPEEETPQPSHGPDRIAHPPVETVSEDLGSDRGSPLEWTPPIVRDSAPAPAAPAPAPLSPLGPESELAVPSASSSMFESESSAVSRERDTPNSRTREEEEPVTERASPVVEEQAMPPSLDDEVPRIAQSAGLISPDVDGEGSKPIESTVPDESLAQEPATRPEPPPPLPASTPTSSFVEALASLFEAHLADATNPIYSRNQIDVFRREALFFDSLVRLTETTTTTGLADADSALAREVMMLDTTESREGQVAAGTSRIGLEGPPELVQDQEQEPEQAENAASQSDAMDLPPTPASYEDDLHPIIERSSKLQRSHDQRSKGISAAAFREVRVSCT